MEIQETAERESSMAYRALELWDPKVGQDITTKTDVWSLGCLLFALFLGKGFSPFECVFDVNGEPKVESMI